MAQDVKLVKNDEGIYDIPLTDDGKDLATIDGLETAIIVSVFTYARANSGDVPDSFNRRGWVGNLLTLLEGYELGSELWVLSQSRINTETLNRGEDFVKRSLQWMLDDGVADTITVTFTQSSVREVEVEIILLKSSNVIGRYITIWNNTKPLAA